MRVLLLGAGGVGSAMATAMSESDVFSRVVVADIDADHAARAVAHLDERRFSACAIDAGDENAIVGLAHAERVDVIVNVCDPRFNPAIFSAAFEAGCHYLDLAMNLSERHSEAPVRTASGRMLGADQLMQSRAWEARGLLALVGMGVEPGLSDIFARYAADHLFSEIDEIGVRDGSDLKVDGYDFAPTFSIWTTIEECLNPPLVWERDRGWYTLEPFSEPETFVFPDGIGPVECVHVEHEEVVLIPRWVECRKVTFKYGLGSGVHRGAAGARKNRSRVDGAGAGARSRRVAARRRGRHVAEPRDARRQNARSHVRGNVGDRHRRRRQATRGIPVPRHRERRVDGDSRRAGRGVADRDQSGRCARARRPRACGTVPACSAPKRSTRCRSSTACATAAKTGASTSAPHPPRFVRRGWWRRRRRRRASTRPRSMMPPNPSSNSENTSTTVDSALIAGETPTSSCPKMYSGSVVEPGPDVKNVITTSSSEIMNASIAPAAMPGAASGSTMRGTPGYGVAPRSVAASIEPVVERREPRLHHDDHERDAERDVGEDHGVEAQLRVWVTFVNNASSEIAHHDLGHDERDEDQRRVRRTAAEPEPGERERGQRPDDRRDERRDDRDLKRVRERVAHVVVVQQLRVPVGREARPRVPLRGLVEAEHDEHDDRREQEREDEDRVQLEVAGPERALVPPLIARPRRRATGRRTRRSG